MRFFTRGRGALFARLGACVVAATVAFAAATPLAAEERLSVLALDAAARIRALPAGDYALSLTGSLNTGTLKKICMALSANDGVRVRLDLSQVMGLAVIDRDVCGGVANLVALTVPDGAVSFHAEAFAGCTALSALEAGDGSERFSSRDGILYSKDGSRLVLAPPALRGSVTIPASVVAIDGGAFDLCSGVDDFRVESGNGQFSATDGCIYRKDGGRFVLCARGRTAPVSVSDGVTVIGERAFAGCARLAEVALPASVREIADGAFCGCASLVALELPAELSAIGKQAFVGCTGLRSLYIPAQVAAVGSRAFYQCGLLSLEFALADGWRYGRKAAGGLDDRTQNPAKFAFPGAYWPYDLYRAGADE